MNRVALGPFLPSLAYHPKGSTSTSIFQSLCHCKGKQRQTPQLPSRSPRPGDSPDTALAHLRRHSELSVTCRTPNVRMKPVLIQPKCHRPPKKWEESSKFGGPFGMPFFRLQRLKRGRCRVLQRILAFQLLKSLATGKAANQMGVSSRGPFPGCQKSHRCCWSYDNNSSLKQSHMGNMFLRLRESTDFLRIAVAGTTVKFYAASLNSKACSKGP